MRSIKGYNLLTNAITTTDLHYDIINGDNFTFFTPTDSSLYALDMNLSAADYTNYVPTLVPVHGLEGVMDFRSLRDAINLSSVAVNLTEDHTPMNAMNDHRESYAPATETSVPVSVTESGCISTCFYGASNLCYWSTKVSSIRDCTQIDPSTAFVGG
ncbi:hypothetical protein QVD17_00685 [Tagetes erecta]|uniref:Uncharacterized protein n=1 Tax=Tagetes erecta TaxID=13708 RepID=A0AAD8L3M4_TARER|nr:hypothetical protein QVD17_00685 [Tagetes erecta]